MRIRVIPREKKREGLRKEKSMAQVTDFKCNNCGAPLIVPKNARKVICPYCYTECNVEGNVVNAEVLNKENIAGGLVHCVSDAMIQKAIKTKTIEGQLRFDTDGTIIEDITEQQLIEMLREDAQ